MVPHASDQFDDTDDAAHRRSSDSRAPKRFLNLSDVDIVAPPRSVYENRPAIAGLPTSVLDGSDAAHNESGPGLSDRKYPHRRSA
jgi:hypothetical protein